jgi:hypothetical protein
MIDLARGTGQARQGRRGSNGGSGVGGEGGCDIQVLRIKTH